VGPWLGRPRHAGAMVVAASRQPDRLDGPTRAGRWARDRAAGIRYEWARRHWPILVAAFALCALPALVVLAVPMAGRQFLSGALVASGAWSVSLLVHTMSGAASAAMGATAEQWTADDLRSLRRAGWRLTHGVRLRASRDIDHVALGPGGLLVVETKWSSDG